MTRSGNELSDSGPNERGPDPGFESTDALSLLGDETRLKILSVLQDSSTQGPMEFSELYERIGAEFTSGFNYHLDKLVPELVSKTDDGYVLTTFGNRVARSVTAGTFTGDREIDPFPVDGACLACSERSLRGSYKDGVFTLECGDCDETLLFVPLPPNLARGRDTDDLIDAIDHWLHEWMRMSVSLARCDICDYCGGTVVSSIVDDIDVYDRFEVLLRFECVDCGEIRRSTVGALASRHPRVQTFHSRRGESLRDRRYWTVEQWLSDAHLTVRSTDPWRFRVTFRADGDTCEVAVDGTPAVTDVSILADEY